MTSDFPHCKNQGPLKTNISRMPKLNQLWEEWRLFPPALFIRNTGTEFKMLLSLSPLSEENGSATKCMDLCNGVVVQRFLHKQSMGWIRGVAKHESGNDLRRCPPFKSGSELQLLGVFGWLSHKSPGQSVYGNLGLVIRVEGNEVVFFPSVRAPHDTLGLILDDCGSLKPGWVVLGVSEGWLRTPLRSPRCEPRARVRVFTGGWTLRSVQGPRTPPHPGLTAWKLDPQCDLPPFARAPSSPRLCPQVWECWVSSLAWGARPPHHNYALCSCWVPLQLGWRFPSRLYPMGRTSVGE